MARVRFSYAPKHEDELELKVPELLEVLGEGEEGWLKGKTPSGKIGLFPSNFCELIPPEEGGLASSADEVDQHEDQGKEILPKKVKGVGFGVDILSGGVKLRPSSQRFPAEEKPDGPPPLPAKVWMQTMRNKDRVSVGGSGKPGTTAVIKEEYARVNFKYEAANEDELDLKVGDEIRILSKDCEDPGWWKGELDGRVGVFPDNFVVLLPPKEVTRTVMSPPAVPAKPKPLVGRANTPEPYKPDKPPETGYHTMPDKPGKWTNGVGSTAGTKATPTPSAPSFADKRKNLDQMFAKRAAAAQGGEPEEAEREEGGDEDRAALAHLNLARPKQPAKRPPSKVFLAEMSTSVKKEGDRRSEEMLEEVAPPNAPAPSTPSSASHTPHTSQQGPVSGEAFARLRAEFEAYRAQSEARIRDLETRIRLLEKR